MRHGERFRKHRPHHRLQQHQTHSIISHTKKSNFSSGCSICIFFPPRVPVLRSLLHGHQFLHHILLIPIVLLQQPLDLRHVRKAHVHNGHHLLRILKHLFHFLLLLVHLFRVLRLTLITSRNPGSWSRTPSVPLVPITPSAATKWSETSSATTMAPPAPSTASLAMMATTKH